MMNRYGMCRFFCRREKKNQSRIRQWRISSVLLYNEFAVFTAEQFGPDILLVKH